MTNSILLVSDDDRADCPLQLALTRTAPQFGVELVKSRAGIEALRTPSVILLDLSQERALEILRRSERMSDTNRFRCSFCLRRPTM